MIYMSGKCVEDERDWATYFGILINGVDTQRTLWSYDGRGGAQTHFPVLKGTTVRFATGGNGYSIGPLSDGSCQIKFVPVKS